MFHQVTIQAYIKGFFRQIWHAMINPYESYVDFMYYVFNLSFGMLMFYFTIIFYVQCVVFTFLIYGVGKTPSLRLSNTSNSTLQLKTECFHFLCNTKGSLNLTV